MLFQDEGYDLTVVMLESVLAALEIKSSLSLSDIDDIFSKASTVRRMFHHRNSPLLEHSPRVAAFAYRCDNINLSFFDFCVRFGHKPLEAAVLNQGICGIASIHEGAAVPLDAPFAGAQPVLMRTGSDTLHVFAYFLSRWVSKGTRAEETFRLYSDVLFSRLRSFCFDEGFLHRIASDAHGRAIARRCFERSAREDIAVPYGQAREAVM